MVSNKNVANLGKFYFNSYKNVDEKTLNAELEALEASEAAEHEHKLIHQQFNKQARERNNNSQKSVDALQFIHTIDGTIKDARVLTYKYVEHKFYPETFSESQKQQMTEICGWINYYLNMLKFVTRKQLEYLKISKTQIDDLMRGDPHQLKFNPQWQTNLSELVIAAKTIENFMKKPKGGSRKHKYTRKTRRRRV